jgi:hypothetical protein
MTDYIKLTAAQVAALPKEGKRNSRLEAAPTDDPDVWIIPANVLDDPDYAEQFPVLAERPKEQFFEAPKARESSIQKYETLATKQARESPIKDGKK